MTISFFSSLNDAMSEHNLIIYCAASYTDNVINLTMACAMLFAI